jgi:hypothetical protein
MWAGRRAGGDKSEAGEVVRRECELEEEQEGIKMKQEKRAEENKRWKKCRRVKSDAGEADGREWALEKSGWAKSEAGKVAEGNVSWKNSGRLKSETGEAGRREWALKKSRRG